jgi:hypothetical protein
VLTPQPQSNANCTRQNHGSRISCQMQVIFPHFVFHLSLPWAQFRIDYTTVADSPEVMFTTHFTSVCINPALYLPWLLGQCLRHGVQVKRASLHHILDAAKLHHTGLTPDVVINCTGLGAAQLHGVRDSTVVPVRGQTIIVNSDPGCMIGVSGSDEGAEELTYVMKRAGGRFRCGLRLA